MLAVNQIVRELSWEWPGGSYEILSRNCNHFCNEFCDKLDVPKLPGSLNCLIICYQIKCALAPFDDVLKAKCPSEKSTELSSQRILIL
jgi:hypothetical protein